MVTRALLKPVIEDKGIRKRGVVLEEVESNLNDAIQEKKEV